LKVSEVPAASDVLEDHVKMHVFEVVAAELPLPVSGLNVAPDGTVSFVQCAPLGTLNLTDKPEAVAEPVFVTVIAPQ
jgi:hypothetical protein